MIGRTLLAMGFLLGLSDCQSLQQAYAQPAQGAPAGNQAAPAGQAPAGQPMNEGPEPMKTVSVSIKNECRDSVNIFYGKDPKFGSGTSSRLGGNSLQNHTSTPGDMIWITDEQRNGIGSATISENTRTVTVTCNGISSR